MRQPNEPASPDTARRVEEALAGKKEIGRSKEVKQEEVVVKTIVKEGGTEIQDPEIIPPSRRGR
jgi:hypothetical protein